MVLRGVRFPSYFLTLNKNKMQISKETLDKLNLLYADYNEGVITYEEYEKIKNTLLK